MGRPGFLALVLWATSAACGNQGGQAILMTGIAAANSAVRRSEGRCYVDCRSPQECNVNNGRCEVPCGGCGPLEVCGPQGYCVFTSLSGGTSTRAQTVY